MSRARRGQVWAARIPGRPHDPHQPRPVLVVSDDTRNQLSDDVLVVPAFSRGRLGPTRVRLPADEGGVDHDSVLFCEEVTCLHMSFLSSGPLSDVSQAVLTDVVRGVRRAIGEVVL